METLYNLWWVYLAISLGITFSLFKGVIKVNGEIRKNQPLLIALAIMFQIFGYLSIIKKIPEQFLEINSIHLLVVLFIGLWLLCYNIFFKRTKPKKELSNKDCEKNKL
ncbi:MAG: hypothetical protein U5L76_01965 [Patescibacteria group bacterium]|nr:hypothetical protein [Patescibacteria group bacterium]